MLQEIPVQCLTKHQEILAPVSQAETSVAAELFETCDRQTQLHLALPGI